MPTKDGLVPVTLHIPRKVRQAFKSRCVMMDVSMGERLAALIREDIARRNPSGN